MAGISLAGWRRKLRVNVNEDVCLVGIGNMKSALVEEEKKK